MQLFFCQYVCSTSLISPKPAIAIGQSMHEIMLHFYYVKIDTYLLVERTVTSL